MTYLSHPIFKLIFSFEPLMLNVSVSMCTCMCVCVHIWVYVGVFYSSVFLLKMINQSTVKIMLTKLIPFKA